MFSISPCYTIDTMKRKNIVGDNIRQFREIAGFTQEELALRGGLSQGYINQLEHGKRNYTQKSLELIAVALSKPVSDFFKEAAKEAPSADADKPASYKTKKGYKKEILTVIDTLPENIIDHYLTLMKLERALLKKTQNVRPSPNT